MEKQIKKPITIAREEFIYNLADLVNNSGLPSFIMEPIIKDVYADLTLLSKQQLERDRQQYHEALSETADSEE